jgi:hypothetical protein
MDKANVAYMHNGMLLTHKEEWNYDICRKMDESGEHHLSQNKTEKKFHVFSHMHTIDFLKRR